MHDVWLVEQFHFYNIKNGCTSNLFQVSQDGKSLLDKLQRPLTPGSADSLMASANYSKAVHHVLDIIHEVLHHQRQLENIWQHRKVRLHQRLQLCVFQQDVQQVRHRKPASMGSRVLT